MRRESWDDYFCRIASVVASRATCPRASIGAVLVKRRVVIGTGFNGPPSGLPHCLERNQTLDQHLALDHCGWSIHAEKNALYNALIPADGATLYVVGPRPICPDCRDYLASRGVTDIRHRRGVPSLDSLARDIGAWGAATFPNSSPASTAEHLRREVEELIHNPMDGEEQADVFHLLVQIARVTDTHLLTEVVRKFEINRQRTWAPADHMGVVEHVREAVP